MTNQPTTSKLRQAVRKKFPGATLIQHDDGTYRIVTGRRILGKPRNTARQAWWNALLDCGKGGGA